MMLIVVMKREIIKRERERDITPKRNKGCTVQLVTTCWPEPSASLSGDQPPPQTIPPNLYSDSMEYPFVQFRSPVLAVLPPNVSCTSSLVEHGNWKVFDSGWALLSNNLNFSVLSTFFSLNPEHSTVPVTRKKMNTAPAETRTPVCVLASVKDLFAHCWAFAMRLLLIFCKPRRTEVTFRWEFSGSSVLSLARIKGRQQHHIILTKILVWNWNKSASAFSAV